MNLLRFLDADDAPPPPRARPVNQRNYVSPHFWIQHVNDNNDDTHITYLDYAVGYQYGNFLKWMIQKEEANTAALDRLRARKNMKAQLRAKRDSDYLSAPTFQFFFIFVEIFYFLSINRMFNNYFRFEF